MFKCLSPLAVAGALLSLTCLGAAPAQALSRVTLVSGKGTDTGTCTEAKPCRTFQFAIDQTAPAGGTAITVNAGPNDKINLTHLTVDGIKTGKNGILLNSGGSLTITHCVVRNFIATGIFLQPLSGITTKFLIGDTLVSDNVVSGIEVHPQGGVARGIFDHVSMNENGLGIGIQSGGIVTAVDSIASNNSGPGFFSGVAGVLRLIRSTVTGNGTGVESDGGTVESFGDNDIRGNVVDVKAFLSIVPKR